MNNYDTKYVNANAIKLYGIILKVNLINSVTYTLYLSHGH